MAAPVRLAWGFQKKPSAAPSFATTAKVSIPGNETSGWTMGAADRSTIQRSQPSIKRPSAARTAAASPRRIHTEQPTCMSAVAAANPPSDLQQWARHIQDLRQRTLAEVAHVVVG